MQVDSAKSPGASSPQSEGSSGKDGTVSTKRPISYGLFAIAVGVSIAVFLLDMSFPLGVAGGVPHIFAILIGRWFMDRRQVAYIILIAIVLVIAGYFLSPSGGVFWVVIINRAIALIAIIATGSLVYLRASEMDKGYAGDALVNHSKPAGLLSIFGSGPVFFGLTILLSVLALTFYVNRESGKSQIWVTHTRKVQAHISHALSLMQDLETGQRGFLLTGNIKYLEPFQNAISQVNSEVDGLKKLTADNPHQQENVDSLSPLIEQKILELNETIALRQTEGLESALRVVNTDVGKIVMDQIRVVLKDMNDEESRLLKKRKLTSEKFQYFTLGGYGLAVFLLFGIAAIIANRIREYVVLRAESEKALRINTDRLQSSQEIAHVGSWDWDITSGDLVWSNEIYNIFGRSRDDFDSTYENFLECIHPEDRDSVTTAVNDAVEKDAPYSIEHRVFHPDGTLRFVHEMGKVDRDGGGKPIRMLGVIHDITERTLLDTAKREFISTVSHELRTPLTSIKGSLGLLQSGTLGGLSGQAQSMLDIAYNNSDRLVLLINDILDIEKIEAGKMDFNIKPTNVALLVKEALKANKGYGDEHDITFICQKCDENMLVNGDKDRLMQVLSNLMSNAAKFSPDGEEVELSVDRKGDSIRINVKDCGPGIPAEFRDSIFKKFTQADASDTRQKGGTGLGLSITKAIVEQHGGTIGFDTEVGKGSTFFFELPEMEQQNEAKSLPTSMNGPYRVLVCEDEADIATLLEMMLRNAGYLTQSAKTAAQAKSLLEGEDFDAMTLDLGLPDQDGISLLQELRSKPKTRDIPIIVVSATASEGKQQLDGNAIGIVDWVNKPIDTQLFIDRLGNALRHTSGTRPRILHVEDEESVLTIISTLVDDTADIIAAKTVSSAKGLLEREAFDLVILDLTLPDGHGEDLLPLLNKPNEPSVPVIIFSAKDVSKETVESVKATLIKSKTSNADLLKTIQSVIEARRSTG